MRGFEFEDIIVCGFPKKLKKIIIRDAIKIYRTQIDALK